MIRDLNFYHLQGINIRSWISSLGGLEMGLEEAKWSKLHFQKLLLIIQAQFQAKIDKPSCRARVS